MAERGSAVFGIGWVVWCGVAFFVVLGGVNALFEQQVVTRYCTHACAAEGLHYDHFRPGGRGGPNSACLCEGEHAIETSVADGGMCCGTIAFLAACYGPFALMELRDRRRKRQATNT